MKIFDKTPAGFYVFNVEDDKTFICPKLTNIHKFYHNTYPTRLLLCANKVPTYDIGKHGVCYIKDRENYNKVLPYWNYDEDISMFLREEIYIVGQKTTSINLKSVWSLCPDYENVNWYCTLVKRSDLHLDNAGIELYIKLLSHI